MGARTLNVTAGHWNNAVCCNEYAPLYQCHTSTGAIQNDLLSAARQHTLCRHTLNWTALEGWWEGGREGWREGGREGWREGGMEGGMEGGREGG